jgi:integrase
MLFLDGGLRLSELAGLQVADVDLRARIVYVAGKASRRSGPRHRAVPLGVKAARALDRYLRERRRHPYADTPRLWLGSRGRPALEADGVDAMLKRQPSPGLITPLWPADSGALSDHAASAPVSETTVIRRPDPARSHPDTTYG